MSRYCLVFWLVFLGSRGLFVLGEDPYKKIWLVGLKLSPDNVYIDDEGYLAGLNTELIPEVCAAAEIQCRTVWIPGEWCETTGEGKHSVGGKALMRGWVDACPNNVGIDMIQIFDFSTEYRKERGNYFYVKRGNTFDPTNISNKTIAFKTSSSNNAHCLARQSSIQGNVLSTNQIVVVDSVDEMMEKILNGEVDAALLSSKYKDYNDQVVGIESNINCRMSGTSMMTRKDSDFNTYWNIGFQKLRNSGRYSKICQELVAKHDLSIECL